MRRLITITALAASLWLGAGAFLSAQPYTTTWPYLYSDFQDGLIYMRGGQKIYQKLNIHLLHGRLHYLDAGVVKEAMAGDIFYVETGKDRFMVVNGDMMRVEAEVPDGFVACHITGDLESLMVGTGAYGMTANTESIQQYSSIDLQKGVNTPHMLLLQEKESGQEFDLKKEYFIVTGGKVYPAYKGDIEKMLPKESRKSFRDYVKANKIRWNDPQKLILLVEFLNLGHSPISMP